MILSKKYQDWYETWCFVMSASFSEISTGHSYDMIFREHAYDSLQQCCFKQLCRSFSCYRDSPLGSLLICITRVNIPRTSNTPVSMQSGEKETHSSDKRGDQMSPKLFEHSPSSSSLDAFTFHRVPSVPWDEKRSPCPWPPMKYAVSVR